MRFISTSSYLLAFSAACVLATTSEPQPPAPTPFEPEVEQELVARQGGATVIVAGATQNPLQVPPVTTVYAPTSYLDSYSWMPFPYTQTFVAVPDQWPSPGVGEIGYGTHTKDKRDDVEETPAPELEAAGIAGRVRL